MPTPQNLRAALFAAFALLAIQNTARADDTDPWGNACHYQWDMSGVLRERSDEDHRRYGGGLHYCVDKGGRVSATVLEPVRDDGEGGCYFSSWNAAVEGNEKTGFIIPKSARVAEYYPGGSVQMQPKPKSGACPRQDDKGYILNDGVPDSVFLEILAMWKQAVIDPSHIEKLFVSKSDAKGVRDFIETCRKENLPIRIDSISNNMGFLMSGVRDKGTAVPLILNVAWDWDAPSPGMLIDVVVHDGRLKFGTVADYKP
jgi:hypothetical protein